MAAAAAAFVAPCVNLFDKYLIDPIVRPLKYLRSSRLKAVVQNLKARRDDQKSKLKAAENAGQVETHETSNWFKDVHEIEMEAEAIEKEYNQGTCVNCWSRFKLGKRSEKLKLKADLRFNEQIAVARPPSPKPVIEIESEPIENQPSTRRTLQQLLDCICDPSYRIIGVYGMGGVGKTTLVGKVNNHFKENSWFETVIMVTVSATPNMQSIRARISERLGLDLSNTNEDGEREKLLDALRKKKFLLILDDVWCKLYLKDVGIPHPRNHERSKIVVVSRNQDTCTDIGATKTIKVQPLTEAESWNLFVEEAGDHVVADRIKCYAEKIVERCEGLPLAIITVAHAMANRHGQGEWANAAREMEQSPTDIRGMEEDVLVLLKFSFDKLEDDMLRGVFLYCACFPEDYSIWKDDIFDYCVGEGLVDRLGSLSAVGNKVEALMGSLKVACMLEDGEHEGSVRMHDMMRDLALWITSPESDSSPKFLIRNGESINEAPQANEWHDATRISLMYTQIKELPELKERCRKLTTLLVRGSTLLADSSKIHTVPPTNFLQYMDHLSILDFTDSQTLEYLPDSLSCLVNLRVLRLRWCNRLRAIPALGMLKQLQVLDLYGCPLHQQILESECLGGLSNLRYLNVSGTQVSIPAGVISRLSKLEELRLIGADNIRWRVSSENEKWDGSGSDHSKGQRVEANNDDDDDDDEEEEEEEEEERRSGLSSEDHHQPSINSIDVGELSHLSHLTSLCISFQGIIISDWIKPLIGKMTKLILNRCMVKQSVIQALNESQNLLCLTIEKCPGLTYAPTRVEYVLEILDCQDLEKVLDGAKASQYSFQSLNGLSLSKLPKLERICVGLAPQNCFGKLSSIRILECNRLKMVFTKEMLCLFNNLKSISICNCDAMEAVIEAEEEDGELLMDGSNNNNNCRVISPFPKLDYLSLENLPALADVCSSNHILHWPLLGCVIVMNCPRLKKNPLHIRNLDGLLVIEDEELGYWEGKVQE